MKKLFLSNITFKIIIIITLCFSLGALAHQVFSESIITASIPDDIGHTQDHFTFQASALLSGMILVLLVFLWTLLNVRILSRKSRNINSTFGQPEYRHKRAPHQSGTGDKIRILAQSADKMGIHLEEVFNEQAHEEDYLETLNALNKALETKDGYTANHSANVTRYSLELGRHLGLEEQQLEVLEQGAMLHDLGKIGIPDHVLKKADILDDVERGIIEQHPPLTSSILDPLDKFKQFSDIARYHHERWDGKGYPDGLNGEDIPLLARIVAITDSWDAMTSDRVYRRGMGKDQALRILEREKESGQWDPYLVDKFVAMHRNTNLDEVDPGETPPASHHIEETSSISAYTDS